MPQQHQYYPITVGETNAGITPSDFSFVPGNVRRYGAVGDGVTDDLDAFNKSHDSFDVSGSTRFGGEILIPEGNYRLSDTWHIKRQVHVKGAGLGSHGYSSTTSLIFPKDVTGIRLWSGIELGEDANASSASLDDFMLYCDDGDTVSGHGIHMGARTSLNHIGVQQFGENGVHIYGSAHEDSGNPNLWNMNQCIVHNNLGNGLYVKGKDTNAGTCMASSFKHNRLWDIDDSSALGNTYIGCHINSGYTGSVRTAGGSNRSIFVSCYLELAGFDDHDIRPPAIIFGGYLAAANAVPGPAERTAVFEQAQGGFRFKGGYDVIMSSIGEPGRLSIGFGNLPLGVKMDAQDKSLDYLKWNMQRGSFDTTYGANIGRRITTNLSTQTTAGRSQPLDGGSFLYPYGLWLGWDDNARHIGISSVKPTDTDVANGDFRHNSDPSELGSSGAKYVITGWKRVNGSWLEMQCQTGN